MIDCPALHEQSGIYPKGWGKKVPKSVRMKRTVCPDFPLSAFPENKGMVACQEEEYPCWTNSHGAVAVVFPDGRKLGVRPDEFEIIEWYEEKTINGGHKEESE